MKIPELYRQTEKDITEELKKLAEAYTPEWRFDPKNPDAGTALALIYGEMREELGKKYGRTAEKNMLEFFRSVGTSLKTAQPASGYVSFGLVNREVEGAELRKGVRLLGNPAAEGGEDVVFETVNDVYVTPAAIEDVYQILPEEDGIYHAYDRENAEQSFPMPFELFRSRGENEQRHVLYLGHSSVLYLEKEGTVFLEFTGVGQKAVDAELCRRLTDPEAMEYAYSTEEGFEAFAGAELREGKLCLHKSAYQPSSAMQEREGKTAYWLRITCRNRELAKRLMLSGISLLAEGDSLAPDLVLAGGVEQEKREYLPFGERMGLYEEVYFASDQALSQKGARISLKFRMNFLRIPSETYGQKPIDWKLVMKREDFIPDPEYDITIGEVIWEYFNGMDWRRLPESGNYAQIFTPGYGTLGKQVEIVFTCPQDMEPVLVHAGHARYIRARILKMNNMYQWNGQYLPPVLSDTKFSYSYTFPYPVPDMAVTENNKETCVYRKDWFLREKQRFLPFRPLAETEDCLYVGCSHPISRGPVRIYFRLQERKLPQKRQEQLSYEYFDGRVWRTLSCVDETEGLQKSGILTFLGNTDFAKCSLFGRERYWLRVRRVSGDAAPCLLSLHANATEILAVETRETERFRIEPNQKHAVFRLTGKNVHDVELWVKEYQEDTKEQLERLRKTYEVRVEEVDSGARREVWVRWKEAEHFASSGPEDRSFVIDRNEGILYFSDGIHGKIPDADSEETILVKYRVGGGSEGNLPADAIQRMSETVGYVNQVTNPRSTSGGADQENVSRAVARKSQELRHRGRAITQKDYEALVLEAAGNIVRVKCMRNCSETGAYQPGHIGIVVLLDRHYENREAFEGVRQKCLSCLKGKAPDFLTEQKMLHIMQPDFVELTVKARVCVSDVNQILDTRSRILQNLERFLDPVHGNFHGRGWEIGEVPGQRKILNLLRGTEGVVRVEHLQLQASVTEGGKTREIDPEDPEQLRFAVAAGKRYEIDIAAGGSIE